MKANSFLKICGGGEFILNSLQSNGQQVESYTHWEPSKAEDYQDSRYSFIVMEKCGASIVEYISEHKKKFSVNSVCQLGIGLIDCL